MKGPTEKRTVPAGKVPRVGSYRLSVGGKDAYKVHEALLAGNVDGVGDVNPVFSQPVRYGEQGGDTGYQTIFIIGQEPFTDVLFGVTTQLSKDLIVDNPTKYAHVNGARRVSELTFYCKSGEIFDVAEKTITRLYDSMEPVTDAGKNLDTVRLVDRDSYVAEFGAEPEEDHRFPVVAVTYSGCDLEYVREAAADTGLSAFEKNGKVYVDKSEAKRS